ncbi:hypothetical protein H920_02369 [Fukomys damarensis]|uniref:Uncharacterized protein n=1 Tax=Fukomys damarensis TaxID=885580 RepID=A0A091DYL0_FUKDA|nr:hypothetical protein H920_02369 [Fukomys damarensis]
MGRLEPGHSSPVPRQGWASADSAAKPEYGICYGDARFDTVSESGTATLKARPRVRPLLTFLPLNAQENHGLAVPTPSVPEDFAGKDVADGNSLVNGSLRLYSSVGDLRLEHSGLDPLIPPPPPGPAPGPPQDFPQPPGESPPPPPPSMPEGPSEPADWRDPDQLEQLRSQLAAYFCGPRREDRALGRRLGPTVAAQDKEGKKGLNPPGEVAPQRLPEKRTPEKTPEKTPSGAPEKGPSLPLPPVDYDPQDAPTPSVQQIRKELEARLSASAEKDARPSVGSLPPKPQPGGGSSLTNGTDDRSPKPVAKDLPTLSPTPQPTALLQTTAAPGPATVKPSTPSHLTAEKSWVPAERGGQQEQPEPQEGIVPSQPGPQTHLTGPTGPPTPKDREEMRLFYKPHSHRSSPSLEAATETPTLARGEATGPGGPVGARGPQVGPATPPVLSPPSDQPLRHPVTGEVVERGSPMALLLAARQRAQKGRPGGLAMGRSLPGSLRGHGGLLESRSDGVFPMDCKPNSFTVVPKEADKVTLLASERKSYVNTFTVRPGTRHPISYAYPRAHRKATP